MTDVMEQRSANFFPTKGQTVNILGCMGGPFTVSVNYSFLFFCLFKPFKI